MPTAVITSGTMIGEISTPMIRPLYGSPGLARPRAASVPRVVARMVAETPMIALLRTARAHIGLDRKSWYQRRLRPGIG